jgi:hypothetical protein
MTIRESILEAMRAAAEPALAGLARVFRSRVEAVTRSEGHAVIIRPADESVNTVGDLAERDFHVQILLLVRGAIPDQVADGIIGPLHEALCADPSFGGLAVQLFEESSRWTYASADEPACELDVRYRVRLYTPETSLTRPLS